MAMATYYFLVDFFFGGKFGDWRLGIGAKGITAYEMGGSLESGVSGLENMDRGRRNTWGAGSVGRSVDTWRMLWRRIGRLACLRASGGRLRNGY